MIGSSRISLVVMGALSGVFLTYLAITALISLRVASQIDRIGNMLIARDDVSVVQFDYDRGLWHGKLTYRLLWRPARSFPDVVPLLEALAATDERVTLAGSLDLRHGPWLGGYNVGLARVNQPVPLPAGLREVLPQFPGSTPALEVTGKMGFTGSMQATFDLADYDGRVLGVAGSAQLQTLGLGAVLGVSPALDKFNLDFRVPLFKLDVADAASILLDRLSSSTELRLQDNRWQLDSSFTSAGLEIEANADVAINDLDLQLDLSLGDDEPLLGDTRFGMGELRMYLPESNLRLAIADYAATGHVGRLDDTIENISSFSLREVQVNDQLLGGIALDTSARGISTQTYMALESLWFSVWSAASMDDVGIEALRALASEQIMLNIDRLTLQLPAEEDLTATLSMVYDGSPNIDVGSLEAIVGAINVEAELQVELAAIDRTISNAGLDAGQKQEVQDLLETLYEEPWLDVEDGRMRTSLQLQQGQLLVNGETLGGINDWLATTESETLADEFTSQKVLGPQVTTLCPDYSQDGAALVYTGQELYAPQSLSVFAGGSTDLGLCTELPGRGFVATAPDYTMDFTDNSTGLALEYRLDSTCDSVLLINDPQGNWHFNDDSNGNMDALLRFEKASQGRWDIWVGSYEAKGCSATLTLETF